MRIKTKAYGETEIDDRQVVRFPDGLLGFEKFTMYAILDAPQKPFYYLQSLELSELSFVLIDPFLFRADYSIDVADDVMERLGVRNPEEVLVFAIVTAPPDGSPITANLMGPLVIGKIERLGFQAILPDPRWQVKHDIVAELAAARK